MLDVCTYFGMYRKMKPLAILWYQLDAYMGFRLGLIELQLLFRESFFSLLTSNPCDHWASIFDQNNRFLYFRGSSSNKDTKSGGEDKVKEEDSGGNSGNTGGSTGGKACLFIYSWH